MHPLPKSLILVALLACAGCAKPSDVSDASLARRDHILAGPHGWIDVTVHAPTAASSPAMNGARPASGPGSLARECQMTFLVDGEPMIDVAGDLAQADAAKSPLGYRFIVAAGSLHAELRIAQCVPAPLDVPLTISLDKGHLALLEFDGQHLALTATQAWEPARLEDIRADVAKLHEHGDATDGALSTLTRFAIASVLLNVVVLSGVAIVVFRRRSR